MPRPFIAIVGRLRRFLRDARAAALVEFALILPPMLLLFLGAVEGSALITVDRRIQIVSGTMGDLVARWDPDTAIDNSTLTDYFKASEIIIYPYDKGQMKQIVSVVSVNADGTTAVRWSCGYNGGVKHVTNNPYTLPPNMKALAQQASGYVVASETSYTYTPVLGDIFADPFPLGAVSYYLPRHEEAINGPANC